MSHSRLLLFLGRWVSVYYLIALVCVYLTRPFHEFGSGTDLYFFAYLVLTITLFWNTRLAAQDPAEPNYSFRNREGWILGGLFLSALIFRFAHIHDSSLWLDEFTEATRSRINYPVLAAGVEHQPPLDYLLSFWGQFLFGLNEFGVRFHAAFISAITIVVAYMLVFKLTTSRFFAFVTVVIYATHGLVWHYSAEARPISLTLFHCFLFFAFLEISLRSGPKPTKPMLRATFAAALLFLVSAGLQPPFLLGSLSIVTAPWLLSKRFGYIARQTLIICVRAVVLYLPIQIKIFSLAINHLPRKAEEGLALWRESIGWPALKQTAEMLTPFPQALLAFAIIGLIAIFICRFLKKPVLNPKVVFAIWLAMAFLVFSETLVPFFHAYIDWGFYDRYIAVEVAVATMAVGAISGFVLDRLRKFYFRFAAIAIAAVILAAFVSPAALTVNNLDASIPREDLRGVFKFLRANATQDDAIYILSLPQTHKWWPPQLYGVDIYYPLSTPNRVPIPEEEMMAWMYANLKLSNEPRRFHVVQEEFWSELKIPYDTIAQASGNHISVQHFWGVSVLTFENQDHQWRKHWFNFLHELEKIPGSEQCPMIAEYRLQEALIEKNATDYVHYRDRVIKIEPRLIPEPVFKIYRIDAQVDLNVSPIFQDSL